MSWRRAIRVSASDGMRALTHLGLSEENLVTYREVGRPDRTVRVAELDRRVIVDDPVWPSRGEAGDFLAFYDFSPDACIIAAWKLEEAWAPVSGEASE